MHCIATVIGGADGVYILETTGGSMLLGTAYASQEGGGLHASRVPPHICTPLLQRDLLLDRVHGLHLDRLHGLHLDHLTDPWCERFTETEKRPREKHRSHRTASTLFPPLP